MGTAASFWRLSTFPSHHTYSVQLFLWMHFTGSSSSSVPRLWNKPFSNLSRVITHNHSFDPLSLCIIISLNRYTVISDNIFLTKVETTVPIVAYVPSDGVFCNCYIKQWLQTEQDLQASHTLSFRTCVDSFDCFYLTNLCQWNWTHDVL
jgi:hypothetical protein